MAEAPKREQKGGVIYEDGRPVGYTKDGALAAVEGGPLDSTVQPDFLVNDLEQSAPAPTQKEASSGDPGEPGITREDAAPLTNSETGSTSTSTRRKSSS